MDAKGTQRRATRCCMGPAPVAPSFGHRPRDRSKMNRNGIEQRIEEYLFRMLLPLWQTHGADRARGGFHERLGPDLSPLPLGYKRLLVQCRQTYTFSHAVTHGHREFAEAAHHGFEFMSAFRDVDSGGWFFKVTPNGEPLDRTFDTYGHAFVLFSLAWYFRAFQDQKALQLARDTVTFLEERLADARDGGFLEGLDESGAARPGPRRQNPHMHLLEGFLALENFTGDDVYRAHGDGLLELCTKHFIDPETETLGEFYDDDWSSHDETGNIVEPGHHFEWTWLFYEAAARRGRTDLVDVANRLYRWAMNHGFDAEHGGIYDELTRDGAIVKESKRIWPVTEAIKATALRILAKAAGEAEEDIVTLKELLAFFFDAYLAEDGRWNEHLDRELKPIHDELPGTTSYHITFGLSEALRALKH